MSDVEYEIVKIDAYNSVSVPKEKKPEPEPKAKKKVKDNGDESQADL
jgi:hypothetical protein